MARKRKNKRRRWIVLLVIVVVFLIIGNLLIGNEPPEILLDPLKVERGDIIKRLTESGTIEMDRSVDVKSQVAGRITRLYADVGDTTAAGALLAIIEPDPNKALQLSGKRASVTRAVMELAEQNRQLEHKRRNYIDGIIPKDEIERAEYLFTLAENDLAQQRLELQILEREVRAQARAVRSTSDSLLFEDYEIVSPIEGIVIERPVEEGELVNSAVSSNQGTILFKVGDPNRLTVKVQISEIDIGEMHPGIETEIKLDAIPGEVFPGRLRHVAPTGGVRSGSAIVTFDAEVEVIGSFRRLRHGMTADVDLILGRALDVLYLPVEGVAEVRKLDEDGKETEEIERHVVFIRSGEDWEEQEVTTGLESNSRIEIVEGLELDMEVHPDAQDELERRSSREVDNDSPPPNRRIR